MSQLWATGPCDVWAQYEGDTAFFVGWGSRPPQIELTPITVPVPCDVAGRASLDKMYAGQVASMSIEFSRYNEDAIALLEDRANPSFDGGSRGTDLPGFIGSLLSTESLAPFIYVRFPFAAKAAYGAASSGGPMVAGYRFFVGILEPVRFAPGASDALKKAVQFSFLPYLDMDQSNEYGRGALVLYDHNMDALDDVD